jgi:hypothetical protein
MNSTERKATNMTDSISICALSSDSDYDKESVGRLTVDHCLSDRKPTRLEDEYEQQNKSKYPGVQDEKNNFSKISTIVSTDDDRNVEDDSGNENDDENENEDNSISKISIEQGKITVANTDDNGLLDFDPSLFSNKSKVTTSSTNEDMNEHVNNPKFNQRKKTKDEKQAEHRLKSKQKRAEYTNRLKVRNCEAWDLLSEEEQNFQKNNRKEKIELSEKVSFFFFFSPFPI